MGRAHGPRPGRPQWARLPLEALGVLSDRWMACAEKTLPQFGVDALEERP
uniref:Uncharacterized protein n=1 Tax=Streptomyces sp. SANK 60404 TaxID=1213862 RepID=A0A1B4ZDG9_9ACTN|nr:hypothetical protein [Streptomyces sp. SANK 60404]